VILSFSKLRSEVKLLVGILTERIEVACWYIIEVNLTSSNIHEYIKIIFTRACSVVEFG
jgi:hypothetical protein